MPVISSSQKGSMGNKRDIKHDSDEQIHPDGPSPTRSGLPSPCTWEEAEEAGEEGGMDGEEEAAQGCAGEDDGEGADRGGGGGGGGAASGGWSPRRRSVSCRRVSLSEASSCRSRRTLVSSLLAVQSDHHLMVFSIWAARARASSSSLSLSSSRLSQSAPAPSPRAPREPRDPSPKPPSPGDSSSGGLELGVPPVGLGVCVRLSGERIPLSEPRPRLHSRPPPPDDLPPSDRWGLGVWFMVEGRRCGPG
ncbi:hypothetical protein EYF80_051028 [Liparis tanakae]|uniref:Uncharacterized protein n=1 Tax=Liparis tanakae TaxID=230148 RepID=A0A4Z2FEG2_9TELE|nr:hypothetical protein EYF80_051028 [Liparis tanakae]